MSSVVIGYLLSYLYSTGFDSAMIRVNENNTMAAQIARVIFPGTEYMSVSNQE